MSEFFEIAYAAASGRLCLFTGTGFSKAVSGNEAPSWQGLLESVCDVTTDPHGLIKALFPANGVHTLSLEEAAQVISIELSKSGKIIHDEIAKKISNIILKGDNTSIKDFLSTKSYTVVTTNYDKLIEQLALPNECQSITPGLPIPRLDSKVKIFHVHGSIDSPRNMVVSSDDYFRFINGESYFSRKLSTVLHENTVVIIGYSLGDTNLKAIISDYKGFSKSHVIGSNIFLVSRDLVAQHIKDYYGHCYGIRVMDGTQVHDFFRLLNLALPTAEAKLAGSLSNLNKVIHEGHHFTDDYLRMESSFYEIIPAVAALGLSIDDHRVVKMLGDIIQKKNTLTQENNAWPQYEHIARWLAYLASLLELQGTSIEKVFLDATLRSMTSMRKELYKGYSWHAFRSWQNRWPSLISSNRALIRRHIHANTVWPDALSVVANG